MKGHRQIYNKKILKQATLFQKNFLKKTTNNQNKKNEPKAKEIFEDIIDEIDKEEQNINEPNNNNNENNNKDNKENNNLNNEEIKEGKKSKIQSIRLKLDDKTLLYSENGLKKYYEAITSTNFNSSDNEKNLNKLITLFRNWHFLLFPNYDMEFFMNKLVDLGKKAPCKSYMSRLRKIYKGEESWDIMYEDQNNILGKASILNEKPEFPNPNKDNNVPNNEDKKSDLKNNTELNKENKNDENSDVMDNLNNVDNSIIEDLIFGDEKANEKQINFKKENKSESNNTIKDEDFENFDYDPEENEKNNITKNLIDSNIKKRSFSEAFPDTKNTLIPSQPKL